MQNSDAAILCVLYFLTGKLIDLSILTNTANIRYINLSTMTLRKLGIAILINLLLTLNQGSATTCKYSVDGVTLDLSALASETLTYVEGQFDYSYTPCRDGLDCTTGSDFMAIQTGNQCHYLARWNASVIPVISGDAFKLTYRNGEAGYVINNYNCILIIIYFFKCFSDN